MASDIVVNILTQFLGKKAFKDADSATAKLTGSVKRLAKAFGVTFGAAALANFSKSAVKAFAADEAAAVRLTQAVNNLGLGFEDTRITRFIADLEKSAHVADDVLRPAFQSLLSTTGSVTKSQDLLNLALEISAGTGVDAAEVAKDLSLAYLGQTKGLSKYNTGLTKTELAAAGFLTIQEKLNAQYSGQNAARLDTYSGKVAAVQIAYGNLQETVGGALVDAFMKLSGDTTVDDLTESVDNLADSLAAVVKLTGAVATPFVGLGKLFGDAAMAYTKALYKVTGTPFMGKVSDRQYGGAAADKYRAIEETANAKARAKAEAEAAKRQKELLALQKKSELAKKNELSLSKAAAEFDTNRISIAAALKNTYDKETRLRLEALMAIEDDDGAKALDRVEQLGLLTKAKQAEKLNGLKGITETELAGLNTTLMAELSKIEATKKARIEAINVSGATREAMAAAEAQAEANANTAQAAAFAKYNDALAKQGGLNDLSFYSQKTQINTLEILRLASIETTTAAQIVADKISLAAGLKTIEEIAAKRKALQDADNEAMAATEAARKAAEDKAFTDFYAALQAKKDAALLADADVTTAALSNIATVSKAKTDSNVLAIDGVASLAAAQEAALVEQSTAALAANADLTTTKLTSIATIAAAEAASNASAIAGVIALSAAIRSIPPYPTYTPPPPSAMPGLPFVDGDGYTLDLGPTLSMDPAFVNPGGNVYTVTINAGAIASQDEFAALLQDTIQQLNRNGDPLTTAGTG